jgi:hypothetical protein
LLSKILLKTIIKILGVTNPQEQGLENSTRKPPREGSENHHQEQPRTTQQGLEEPRRIVYTYQEASYNV